MKSGKFIGAFLAGVLTFSAFVGLAACGKDNGGSGNGGGNGNGGGSGSTDCTEHVDANGDGRCDKCGELTTDKNKDWTGNVYNLVGTGSGSLFANDWDPKKLDADLIFTAAYASDGVTEVHTLEIELYEGDVFQIIHGGGWSGQLGFNSLENEGKDDQGIEYFIESPSIGDISDIQVAEGQSGTYELTLTIGHGGGALPVIGFEKKSSIADSELALLKLVDAKGSPCFSTNFLKHAHLKERGGIFFKKGVVIPAIPYTPAANTTPVAMTFGGWDKDGEKWKGGKINSDMTLTVHYDEAVDTSYIADKADAAYYLIGESTYTDSLFYGNEWKQTAALRLGRSEGYKYHNVYELKRVILNSGDKFQIGWGNDQTSKFSWIASSGEVKISDEPEKAEIAPNQSGVYDVRIIVTVDASGTVQKMNISLNKITTVPYGYYLVGTYLDPTFGPDADDPYSAFTSWFYEESTGKMHANVIVTERMFAEGTQYAEFLIREYSTLGDGPIYGVAQNGGTAQVGEDAPHFKLGAGVWRINFDPAETDPVTGETTSWTISWEAEGSSAED